MGLTKVQRWMDATIMKALCKCCDDVKAWRAKRKISAAHEHKERNEWTSGVQDLFTSGYEIKKRDCKNLWGNPIVSLLQLVHALAAIIISMQAEHRITQVRYWWPRWNKPLSILFCFILALCATNRCEKSNGISTAEAVGVEITQVLKRDKSVLKSWSAVFLSLHHWQNYMVSNWSEIQTKIDLKDFTGAVSEEMEVEEEIWKKLEKLIRSEKVCAAIWNWSWTCK